MKVVCIDDKNINPHNIPCVLPNGPVVYGETYTVINSGISKDERCFNEPLYVLEEKPIIIKYDMEAPGPGWWAKRFVTLEYFNAEFKEKEIKDCLFG